MLDGWDIYWIMQLDEIRSFLSGIAIPFGIISAIASIAGLIMFCVGRVDEEEEMRKNGKLIGTIGVVSMLLLSLLPVTIRAFIPTTKTMACVVILPAIVNNEDVQAEAREIYDLAKDALRDLVGQEPE